MSLSLLFASSLLALCLPHPRSRPSCQRDERKERRRRARGFAGDKSLVDGTLVDASPPPGRLPRHPWGCWAGPSVCYLRLRRGVWRRASKPRCQKQIMGAEKRAWPKTAAACFFPGAAAAAIVVGAACASHASTTGESRGHKFLFTQRQATGNQPAQPSPRPAQPPARFCFLCSILLAWSLSLGFSFHPILSFLHWLLSISCQLPLSIRSPFSLHSLFILSPFSLHFLNSQSPFSLHSLSPF